MLNLTLGDATSAPNQTCPVDASFAMDMCPVGFEQPAQTLWGTLLSPFKMVFEWVKPGLEPINIYHGLNTYNRIKHKQFDMSLEAFEKAVFHDENEHVIRALEIFCEKLTKFHKNYDLSDAQLYLVERIAQKTIKVNQLSGIDLKRLVHLYKFMEDSTEMESIYMENIDYVVKLSRLGLTRGVDKNPIGMTVSQALTAGHKVHNYYYQNKTKVAQEALYNGLESISYAIPMSVLLGVAAPWLGTIPTIAAGVAAQIALGLNLPQNYFNLKKKLFTKRHQALANYYQALMSGNFGQAKYYAFELIEMHDIDVEDVELLGEVEETSPMQIVNQFKGMLSSGMYKTLISEQSPYKIITTSKQYQREMNRFNMKTLSADDLSELFPHDCALDILLLNNEKKQPDANIEKMIEILSSIKEKNKDLFLLHSRLIASMSATKGTEIFKAFYQNLHQHLQTLEDYMQEDSWPMDDIIETLKEMRTINMEGYIYYMHIMAHHVNTIAYEVELTDLLNNPQGNEPLIRTILEEIKEKSVEVYEEYLVAVNIIFPKKPFVTQFELGKSQVIQEDTLPELEVYEPNANTTDDVNHDNSKKESVKLSL